MTRDLDEEGFYAVLLVVVFGCLLVVYGNYVSEGDKRMVSDCIEDAGCVPPSSPYVN